MKNFRWGILGTGNIARSMAAALPLVPGAEPFAVASRSEAKASAFSSQWGFSKSYGTYEGLLADPDVDIVYIATPNALHKENVLSALRAGKHILCEKPLTTSAEDSQYCAEVARGAGLFLMEAMWTTFFPAMQKAVSLVQQGAIGRPHHMSANFISYRDPKEFPNLFDPELGGGASLDLGIYPLAAAQLLLGSIKSAKSEVIRTSGGVDGMVAMVARHECGAISQLGWGFSLEMPISLKVTGELGVIEIEETFHQPRVLRLEANGTTQYFDLPPLGNGYAHEAIHVQEMIAQGSLESSIWPHRLTTESAALVQSVVDS